MSRAGVKRPRQRQEWYTVSVHASETEAEAACRSTGACEWVVYDSKESVCKRFVCKRSTGTRQHADCCMTVRWKKSEGSYHVQLAKPCASKSHDVSQHKALRSSVQHASTIPAASINEAGTPTSATNEMERKDRTTGECGATECDGNKSSMDFHKSKQVLLTNATEEIRGLRLTLNAKDELIGRLTAELAAAQTEVVQLREMLHLRHYHDLHHGFIGGHSRPHHGHGLHAPYTGSHSHHATDHHYHHDPHHSHHHDHHDHHHHHHDGGHQCHSSEAAHVASLNQLMDQLFPHMPGPSAKAVCE